MKEPLQGTGEQPGWRIVITSALTAQEQLEIMGL